MRHTTININSKMNQEFFNTKKQVRVNFKSRGAEIIAWVVFFGIGVGYFVTTLLLAL